MYSFVPVKVSLQSGNFETYSILYELPTGDRWASELWLSHWRRIWDVRKGDKESFRGFCSADTQDNKWGTGDNVSSAIQTHTASPSADCQSWGGEKPVTQLEKRLYKMSLICHLPSCAMTTHFPINCSYMHTVSRYLANHWLAEVSIYNYLKEEKEKLIETHLRLHT